MQDYTRAVPDSNKRWVEYTAQGGFSKPLHWSLTLFCLNVIFTIRFRPFWCDPGSNFLQVFGHFFPQKFTPLAYGNYALCRIYLKSLVQKQNVYITMIKENV